MSGVLERTLGILELLSQHGGGLELGAIADALNIPRSGTHRLLAEHPELSGKLALQIGFGAGLVYGAQVVVLP